MKGKENYYTILELDTNKASQLDVKKAYRRLALKYHPDRNGGCATSKDKFQLIGEAYETLSDVTRRSEYDRSFRYDNLQQNNNSGINNNNTAYRRNHPFRDPYERFNDLFQNDRFFRDAFAGMDNEFSQRFNNDNTDNNSTPSKKGWFPWIMESLGVNFQVSTRTVSSNGTVTSSYSSSSSNHARGRNSTDKKSRTYIDKDGHRMLIRSMEKNGNRMEDVYKDGELMERKINGVSETMEKLNM